MFFCLSLMVQTPDVAAAHHQEGALLQVTLKDVVRNTQVNQNVSDIKVEWNVKQIKFHFTRQVTGSYKLVIKTTSLQTVHVSQITICNEDGEDVYSLPPTSLPYKHLPKTKDRDEPLLPIYAARNPLTTVVDDDVTNTPGNTTSGSCLNGGVPSGWSCRCPPGFTGDNCQLGCGRNRFGQDCGGRCSFRVGECRGLLLCNDATKCQCAPGYTGDQCDQSCRGGVYGNDCLQRCGNCADDVYSCDKYTGECAGCQPGYRLPHCTLPHVYYPLKPELSSLEYGVIKVTFDPKRFASSDDQPQLYQIQFREKDSSWRVLTTKSLKEDIKENNITIEESIGNLKTGQLYEVRVLLLDASFNKYDGSLVQNAEILTKCEIPEDYDYKVKYSSNTSSYTFTWTYSNTSDHWCPVECYEVSWKDNYRWLSENTTLNSFTLASRLSGLTTEFEVQAKTTGGAAPHSKPLYASTLHSGTFSVRNLRMVSSQSTSLKLAWEPPNYSDGQVLSYNIKYKCVDQPACSPGCFNATEGALSQQDTSVILSSLLPFAQYQVSVTPDNGPESRIFVGTSKVVPGEKPLLSEKNKIERANTSVTVFWEPVPVCSGFMLGYNYQLAMESEPLRVVVGGFTRGTSFAFHNLSASTAYVVKVYIVTVAGWNPDAYLEINTSTSATVPEAVQQLTVYKKGRSVLGLRWAAPKAMYGHLKSFTVTVAHAPGHSDEQSRTVEPKRCTAWPDLYCHTIEALRPNRNYTVSVSTRNSEVAEDGAVASVWAVTKEAPPTAPVGLRLSNASETSVGLRWEHPDLANGLLRSFLVSVEETERFDQDACCQVYPLIETPVTEENQTYEAEVSGLQPAATYYVSVSAKTVGLGPAQSLVVHTRPPHLPLATVLPSLEGLWDGKVTWQTPRLQADAINSSDVYAPLVKARLLLAVVNETAENVSGIFDTQLDSLLRKNIGKPFVFVAEYTEGDVATDLLIYNDGPAADSEWGRGIIGLSSDDILGLVAAQIAGYNGAYNADLVLTTATGTNNDSS